MLESLSAIKSKTVLRPGPSLHVPFQSVSPGLDMQGRREMTHVYRLVDPGDFVWLYERHWFSLRLPQEGLCQNPTFQGALIGTQSAHFSSSRRMYSNGASNSSEECFFMSVCVCLRKHTCKVDVHLTISSLPFYLKSCPRLLIYTKGAIKKLKQKGQ